MDHLLGANMLGDVLNVPPIKIFMIDAGPPRTIPAQFEPADVPTVVLVDDPKQVLAAPQMMDQLAFHIGDHLLKNEALSPENLIDPAKVTRARIDQVANH